MILDDILGRIVISAAGRDKGKAFVVVKVINEHYVIISDGDLRKVENAKMKNIKHLHLTHYQADDLAEYLEKGEVPPNHIVRKNIKKILETSELTGEGGRVNG